MRLLLWLFFLFTCSHSLLSLAHVNNEGLQLLQDKQIKGLNGSTESNQRGPGAFYINRLQRSMRAASRGAGRSIRGGGTSTVNHPKGSGHSGASSIRAFPSFSIYNSLVLVSIGLLLSLMFF